MPANGPVPESRNGPLSGFLARGRFIHNRRQERAPGQDHIHDNDHHTSVIRRGRRRGQKHHHLLRPASRESGSFSIPRSSDRPIHSQGPMEGDDSTAGRPRAPPNRLSTLLVQRHQVQPRHGPSRGRTRIAAPDASRSDHDAHRSRSIEMIEREARSPPPAEKRTSEACKNSSVE